MRVIIWLTTALLVTVLCLFTLDSAVKSPKFQLLGSLVNHVKTNEKVVALTFDDGPNPPNTERLLDILAHHQVKATFFLIGRHVEQYPEATRLILARGHEVGNHTYTHTQRYLERPAVIRAEIEQTDVLLRRLGATGEINFRAPYGRKLIVLPYVLSRMGKRDVLWDVDPHDYEDPEPEVLAGRIAAQVRPGSIILLHDRPQTTAALEKVIAALREQGYALKTVSELMRQPGRE